MIPFNRASLAGCELDNMQAALESGHISGDGPFTRACQGLLERSLGVPKALLTTSCTHALEMAALLLDLKSGDDVIAPSFTFVSSVNAFVLRGARPVFVDIRDDTLNIDERAIGAAITSRTRAILVVHYAGVGCDMDAIGGLSAERGVPIVEDNAHGLFGRYRGRHLGTFGPLATLSFHETKNFTCGEGGALLVNDPAYVDRAEIVREKGTDRSRFFRGQVDKYTWVDLGSSFLPSDLLAGFLLAQLEAREAIQRRRREIFEGYLEGLRAWARHTGVGLPIVPPDREQAYHMFYLRLPNRETRQRFIATLKAQGILSVFHYVPLHSSPMGRQYGYRPGDFPVTERVSDQLVRLPFFSALTGDEQRRVVDAVLAFEV